MKNSDMPAKPAGKIELPPKSDQDPIGSYWKTANGLTKLEYACIHCGVPKTGDADLDAIIEEGNRIKAGQQKDPLSPAERRFVQEHTLIGGPR